MDDSHVPNPISEQLALHFVCRFQAPLDVWSLLAKHYPESSELADGMGRCQVGDVSRPWNLLTKNHVRQPESSAFCRRSVRKVCKPLRRNKFKTVQSRFNLPVLDSRFFSNDKKTLSPLIKRLQQTHTPIHHSASQSNKKTIQPPLPTKL